MLFLRLIWKKLYITDHCCIHAVVFDSSEACDIKFSTDKLTPLIFRSNSSINLGTTQFWQKLLERKNTDKSRWSWYRTLETFCLVGGQISKQKPQTFKVREEINPPFQTPQWYFELSKLISKVSEARLVNYCSCRVLGVTASGKLFKCLARSPSFSLVPHNLHVDSTNWYSAHVLNWSSLFVKNYHVWVGNEFAIYPSHRAPVKKCISSLAGKKILAFFQAPLFIP